MERYRSGHNEAVLKTVWVQAHVGSNPTLSANKLNNLGRKFEYKLWEFRASDFSLEKYSRG